MQQSAFSRTRRSHDGDDFTGAKHEIDSVQNGDGLGSTAVDLAQRPGFQASAAQGFKGFCIVDRYAGFNFGHDAIYTGAVTTFDAKVACKIALPRGLIRSDVFRPDSKIFPLYSHELP